VAVLSRDGRLVYICKWGKAIEGMLAICKKAEDIFAPKYQWKAKFLRFSCSCSGEKAYST
jgi:hypothetical protein